MKSIRVIALTLAPFLLSAVTPAQESATFEPEYVVLFRDETLKLRVDHNNERSLQSPSESLKIIFYENCTYEDPSSCTNVKSKSKHRSRSFTKSDIPECVTVRDTPLRKSSTPLSTTHCVIIDNGLWHGGIVNVTWPLNELQWPSYIPFVTTPEHSVIDTYFFNSHGFYIYIDRSVPLFVRFDKQQNLACFNVNTKGPYYNECPILEYQVCKYNDPREAHQNAITNHLGRPKSTPDNFESIVKYPIWSTRAIFGASVNETSVEKYSQGIKDINSTLFSTGTIDIDDTREHCNINAKFNTTRFKNMTNLVENLKKKGFNTSLWIDPFVGLDCGGHIDTLKKQRYFVNNTETKGVVPTWSDKSAYYVDFTNPHASRWWLKSMEKLLYETGFDSLTFVGGEFSWYPENPILYSRASASSTHIAKKCLNYIVSENPDTVMRIKKNNEYSSTEYKAFRGGQEHGNFLRMLDYHTDERIENVESVLKMMVPTLIHSNMMGYPFVIPNMISKVRNNETFKKLYIRWAQAVTFMPAVQFSHTPWDIDNQTVEIVKDYLKLRERHTPTIIELMKNSANKSKPVTLVNPPIWWIDPTNQEAHKIDDEYLLGENILVAPVTDDFEDWFSSSTSRSVYLPKGFWQDENHPLEKYCGRQWIDFYSESSVLPWFTKQEDKNHICK